MITYKTLTKLQAMEWRNTHPFDPSNRLTNSRSGSSDFLRLESFKDYEPDEVVAILALDDDRVIGKINLGYSDILIDGVLQRCIVGRDLFVREEYRSKAVGISILLTVLRLGKPYFAASVSAAMRKIFDSWRIFHLIDSHPIYPVGIDFAGTVRLARLTLHREHEEGNSPSVYRPLSILFEKGQSRLRIRSGRQKGFTVLSPKEAIANLDQVLAMTSHRIQIPWNYEKLVRSLRSHDPESHAWVIRTPKEHGSKLHLVCMYTWTTEVSIMRTSDIRKITIAGLTEVFPPLDNEETTQFVLSFAYQQAQKLNASIMFIYAMTETLRAVCTDLRLENTLNKKVYMAPNGLDREFTEIIVNPKNWWCRARNEEQFVEAYKKDFVGQQTEGAFLL